MTKMMLMDARTKELREIEPSRLGTAKWDTYEGRRLIHVEIKTGKDTEVVPLENPPNNFVEQAYILIPGSEIITFFSPDSPTGLIRRALSFLHNSLHWSPERIESFLKFLLEEGKQLRLPPPKPGPRPQAS